jgi:DNA-binding ferritin-like protein
MKNRTGSMKNRTRKNRSKTTSHSSFEKEIVITFLQMLNNVKLYHWKTHSFATHKATDDLYAKLNENIDSFVEVLLGKYGDRANLTHVKTIQIRDFSTQEQFKKQMNYYKEYLISLDNHRVMKMMANSDLYNIRDEMLANLNQLLYLLTFK